MKRLFDPEAIRAQLVNLRADRERLDQAIHAMEVALRNIEDLDSHQNELAFEPPPNPDITLQDAVKRTCLNMIDDISRQRVLSAIERQYPFLKPNSSSVSAALINMAKGENPVLRLAAEGRGRNPALYSTEGDTVTQLNAAEIADLMEPINGVGGWQSLWLALQKQFDKGTGTITLTPALRARVHHYFHSYGGGGYQNRAKRVFRRELPHLFVL
jgi:hypothetical protein